MYAVLPFIHQDRDGGIRSSIGNLFDHFFHYEWIADHESHDFRRVEPGFLAQNRAKIEFHEDHEFRLPESVSNHIFQFSEGPCTLGGPGKHRHVGTAHCRPERHEDLLERLGRYDAEPFRLDSFGCHDSSLVRAACKRSHECISSITSGASAPRAWPSTHKPLARVD